MGHLSLLNPEDVIASGGDHSCQARFISSEGAVQVQYMLRRAAAHLPDERTRFLLRMYRLERNDIAGMPLFTAMGNGEPPAAIFRLPESFGQLNLLQSLGGCLSELETVRMIESLCQSVIALEAKHAAPAYLLPEDICISRTGEFLLLPSALRDAGRTTSPPAEPLAMFFAASELLEIPEKAGKAAVVFSIGRLAAFALHQQELPGPDTALSAWLRQLHTLEPSLPYMLSEPFRQILQRTLNRNPDARFTDCHALLQALHTLTATPAQPSGNTPPIVERERSDFIVEPELPAENDSIEADSSIEVQEPAAEQAVEPVLQAQEKPCVNLRCRKGISISAAYCRFCGRYQLADRTKRCPHCGNQIPFSSDYCQVCENIL
jgi:hypothetical protein